MSNEELSQRVVGDKVYAVSSGEYSDYHIDCVFRTKEEAEGWISKRWSPDDYTIEEWEFDTYNPSQLIGFEVEMRLEDGYLKWGEETEHVGPAQMRAYFYKTNPEYRWSGPSEFRLEVSCLALNKEHAIKIASEYRRMVLASPMFETWKNSPDPSGYEMKSNELSPCAVV